MKRFLYLFLLTLVAQISVEKSHASVIVNSGQSDIYSLEIPSDGRTQAQKEILADPNKSASNHLVYPGPDKKRLTPVPKGYVPFYISHYGRHGSRYLIPDKIYDYPYQVLLRADSLEILTGKGKQTLRRITAIRNEAMGRHGELTSLGAEQHQGIARRMYQRFPEVFRGKTHVDAKSTVVIRCILSMENGLHALLRLNPELDITHDASCHDMYYMNQQDTLLQEKKMSGRAKEVYDRYSKQHENYQNLMKTLFKVPSYWQDSINTLELSDDLFHLARSLQSTDLRGKFTLYDIFTADEIYDNWLRSNAYWYVTYGPSPLNGGTQPYSQRNLLKNIISTADSCIMLSHPGATLRYGHDTMVMPLTCLLGLNGYDKKIGDLDSLVENNWLDYRIFPMACNIQFIFYRSAKYPGKILVKVLLNENEATLPIKPFAKGCYEWRKVRGYYLEKLSRYVGN